MQKHEHNGSDYFDARTLILKYYVGLLRSARTDHNYLKTLVTKVIPLIHLVSPSFIAKWNAKKERHLKKRKKLELKAHDELTKTFFTLKQRATEADLLINEHIKKRICCIENMFKRHLQLDDFKIERDVVGIEEYVCSHCGAKELQHRPFMLPSYNWGIFDQLTSLCDEIFNLGRPDLVADLVEIREARYLPDHTGKLILREAARIERPLFAPSMFEIVEFDNLFSWTPEDGSKLPPWIAWNTLRCAEWDNLTSRDFLRKKNLRYKNEDDYAVGAHLLQLHSLKADLRAIRKKQQGKKVILFNRDRFEKALDIVLKKIYGAPASKIEQTTIKFPYSITLMVEDDLHLRLRVEWTPGIIEIVHLHSFRDDEESSRYNFIEDLINNAGDLIAIKGRSSTDNVSKVLQKAGIKGVLYDLFIAQRTKREAALYSRTIFLAEKPEATLEKLRRHIQKLESCGWK